MFTTMILIIFFLGCISKQSFPTPSFTEKTSTQTILSNTNNSQTNKTTPFQTTGTTTSVASVLSESEARNTIRSLLRDNAGCQLPCLWKLTPGMSENNYKETPFVSMFRQSSNSVINVKDFTDGGSLFLLNIGDLPKKEVILFSTYLNENRLVQYSLSSYITEGDHVIFGDENFNRDFNYYLLPQILSNYGRPNEIWVATWQLNPISKSEWNPFTLVLYYKDLGFIIQYKSPAIKKSNDIIACPNEIQIDITVWNVKQETKLESIISKGGSSQFNLNPNNMNYFRTIDKGTDYSLDQFYQTFKDPNNRECIKTPANLWTKDM